MDAEVDDGESRQQRVSKDRVAITVPAAVVIKPCQAEPNRKRNTDVERRHAIGERVNAPEPIGNFRC